MLKGIKIGNSSIAMLVAVMNIVHVGLRSKNYDIHLCFMWSFGCEVGLWGVSELYSGHILINLGSVTLFGNCYRTRE